MIKFLHAADLHLGLRITRFEKSACERIEEARFQALEQIRNKAAEHQVNFVLIAGDVFDDHSVTKRTAERAFTLFEGKTIPCPVFIIPGNHDPLTPGGVWDRDPWTRDQPTKHTYLLREPTPVPIPGLPVMIFPCPLRNRNSIDDPTSWIDDHPRVTGDQTIRISLAHGSLNHIPNLPLDDHLIRKDAAAHEGLDYLALGHWHKLLLHPSADGVKRTAYSGAHEPMRFPDSGAGRSTGWSSYSTDGDAERFQDDGRGTPLLVSIDEAGAPPLIETLAVGHLRWSAERVDMTSQSLGEIITRYAEQAGRERMVIKLILYGVLDPDKHQRIGEVLRKIVGGRYHPGSNFHTNDVLVEPASEQFSKIVGDGVLLRMLERLRQESASTDAAAKRVADHALKLLYRIACEEQPQ